MRLLVAGVVAVGFLAPADAFAAECTDRFTKAHVHTFAEQLSRGDLRQAVTAWAGTREFKWYSTNGAGERLSPHAQRRDTLRGYFAQRIAQHEQLQVTQLRRTLYERRRDIRHFNGTLKRSADDLTSTRFGFKGALSCRTGKLIVWSMGTGSPP